jgi:hypothetical protein
MTITTFLLFWILLATRTHYRAKDEALLGGFAEQLIVAIRKQAGIPQRLAFICDQDRVANFQVDDRIKKCHPDCQLVWIADRVGKRKLR